MAEPGSSHKEFIVFLGSLMVPVLQSTPPDPIQPFAFFEVFRLLVSDFQMRILWRGWSNAG
jgi:hypothetical protein